MCSEEDTRRWSAATFIKADRLTMTALFNAPIRDYCKQIDSGRAQGEKAVSPPTHREPGSTLMGNTGDGGDAIKTH